MTNVSKLPLSKFQYKESVNKFMMLFSGSTSAEFFNSFFTEAEKIMFLKRLGVILMINQGCSKYRISKTLHVSESTVRYHSRLYFDGEYNILLSKTKKKTFDDEKFWNTLGLVLRVGLPPKVSASRRRKI